MIPAFDSTTGALPPGDHRATLEEIRIRFGFTPHWPAVHRLDAAQLYRLALEKGTTGARYHGVADEGIPFRKIAEVIGRRLSVPVISKSPGEAVEHFGWISHFVSIDCPASSEDTQRQLGWRPTRASLIPDIDRPSYFEAGTDAASAAEGR